MRSLYFTIFLALLIGSAGAQAQSGLDFGQPERQDISKSVQIYPIPAVEFVHIRLEHVNLDDVRVKLHNIIGNEINIETEKIDEHTLRIKVKELDAGYYLIALSDDQAKFKGIYKFLKR
jgi:hypothetical protein